MFVKIDEVSEGWLGLHCLQETQSVARRILSEWRGSITVSESQTGLVTEAGVTDARVVAQVHAGVRGDV